MVDPELYNVTTFIQSLRWAAKLRLFSSFPTHIVIIRVFKVLHAKH